MNNPFWEYSLSIYRHRVQKLCLQAQDECGVDVNVLLYVIWVASLGLAVDKAHLLELDTQIKPWRDNVVQPLRVMRRHLKRVAGDDEVYERAKALELYAEQRQQANIWRWHQQSSSTDEALRPAAALAANLELLFFQCASETATSKEIVGLLCEEMVGVWSSPA